CQSDRKWAGYGLGNCRGSRGFVSGWNRGLCDEFVGARCRCEGFLRAGVRFEFSGNNLFHFFIVHPNFFNLMQESFPNDVLKSPTPVLVDFWAEWCGPCKMIAPVLDELAEEYEGRVRIGKVNIDEQQALAAEYGIRAIPTLLLFNQGEVAEQIVGLKSKRDLK